MNIKSLIIEILKKNLSPQHLEVVDQSDAHTGHLGARQGGGHYSVTIVSEACTGKNPFQRHRMIYSLRENELKEAIHALQLTTLTPGEWK